MPYLLAATAVLAALAPLVTIGLLVRQLRLSRELAQRSSQYNFLDSSRSRVLEVDADRALARLGIGKIALRLGQPLSTSEAEILADDPEGHYAVNYLLNDLENLCVAREFDMVSAAVFDRVHSSRITWWAHFLHEYIHVMQIRLRDAGLWTGVHSHIQTHDHAT
jgi:hypothetical protein